MQYDAVVIGAGPAGLSSAFAAANAGARVAVLEKSKEIGYPIHTSGGSWIDELRKLNIPEHFTHPIYEAVFIAPETKATFKYQEPPSCILDVRGLYQYLAEQASAAGAEIFVNATVSEPYYEENRISGVAYRRFGQTHFLKAPLIIDASGINSVIARKLGLSKGVERVGVGAEYDLYAPNWPTERVAFLFGGQVAPSGYGWIFPHHNHRVRLGVGVIRPDTKADPKVCLENILTQNTFVKNELSPVSRLEYHTGIIPSEIYLPQTYTDGVLVVGDAGGLVSTLLGEGIRFAIDIGRLAGEIAGRAAQEKRFDAAFLAQYETAWKKKYNRVFRIGAFVNKRLAQYSDADWNRKISELTSLDSEFLPLLLKGEFSAKILFRIISTNPGLFKKTLAASLKSILKNA